MGLRDGGRPKARPVPKVAVRRVWRPRRVSPWAVRIRGSGAPGLLEQPQQQVLAAYVIMAQALGQGAGGTQTALGVGGESHGFDGEASFPDALGIFS